MPIVVSILSEEESSFTFPGVYPSLNVPTMTNFLISEFFNSGTMGFEVYIDKPTKV